jgi:hypothetical protein
LYTANTRHSSIIIIIIIIMSSSSPYKYKATIDDYDKDNDDEAHELFKAPADFSGPVQEGRYCTDVLCLFFLILAWAIMTSLGVYAVYNGDYRHVLYPLDYQGNICGTDYNSVDMTEYPYLLYVNFYTGGVCVQDCPSLQGEVSDSLTDMNTLVTYGGVFQNENAQLSADFITVAPHYNSSNAGNSNAGNNSTTTTDDSIMTQDFQCTIETCFGSGGNVSDPQQSWTSPGINEGYGIAYYAGDTYPLFQRCYLTQEVKEVKMHKRRNLSMVATIYYYSHYIHFFCFLSFPFFPQAEDQMAAYIGQDAVSYFPWTPATSYFSESSQQFFTNLYGDLWEARWYILGFGFGASLVVSLLYMGLLRIPCLLTGVVWSSIALVIGLFACKRKNQRCYRYNIHCQRQYIHYSLTHSLTHCCSFYNNTVVGYYAYTKSTTPCTPRTFAWPLPPLCYSWPFVCAPPFNWLLLVCNMAVPPLTPWWQYCSCPCCKSADSSYCKWREREREKI